MLDSELGKDPKIAYKAINARAESVDAAPLYRQAFKKRRCLIPGDGFYEWKNIATTAAARLLTVTALLPAWVKSSHQTPMRFKNVNL